MITSWKTSLLGLALVALGVIGLSFGKVEGVTGGAIITAGLGLVASKDSNVTGGTKPQ